MIAAIYARKNPEDAGVPGAVVLVRRDSGRMGNVILSGALLAVGLSGCAPLAQRFESVRNECQTWVTTWRPEIGYGGVPVAVLPVDKRLDACVASRAPRFMGYRYEHIPTQYQGRLRFNSSGAIQALYVWLVNVPGD